jgi:hypothetical protein
MVTKLKVPPEKVQEVKKRLLSNTLTEEDCKVLLEIMDESIALGLVRMVPSKEKND